MLAVHGAWVVYGASYLSMKKVFPLSLLFFMFYVGLYVQCYVSLVVLCGCCLVAQACLTLCDPVNCSSKSLLSFTIYPSLRRLMPIESVMPSNHVILGRPLPLLSSVFPSIRVFSNEPALRLFWPKCWSFSFSISPSSEYSRLISFRIDWLNLLAVQGTLKSLLQHHSLKASILQCSAFLWSNSHIYT